MKEICQSGLSENLKPLPLPFHALCFVPAFEDMESHLSACAIVTVLLLSLPVMVDSWSASFLNPSCFTCFILIEFKTKSGGLVFSVVVAWEYNWSKVLCPPWGCTVSLQQLPMGCHILISNSVTWLTACYLLRWHAYSLWLVKCNVQRYTFHVDEAREV